MLYFNAADLKLGSSTFFPARSISCIHKLLSIKFKSIYCVLITILKFKTREQLSAHFFAPEGWLSSAISVSGQIFCFTQKYWVTHWQTYKATNLNREPKLKTSYDYENRKGRTRRGDLQDAADICSSTGTDVSDKLNHKVWILLRSIVVSV